MKGIVRTAVVAGAAVWLIKRAMHQRARFERGHSKHALQNWENEGGNLRPGSHVGADLTREASQTEATRAASRRPSVRSDGAAFAPAVGDDLLGSDRDDLTRSGVDDFTGSGASTPTGKPSIETVRY